MRSMAKSARVSTKTAAERAEETERRRKHGNRKRLVAANDLWRAHRMLRCRRKLESHLAHAHITRVRVRDGAEFAAKLAAAAGEAKTRGEEQGVDERRGRWGGEETE